MGTFADVITPRLIYIAAPYTSPDPVVNSRAAIDAAMRLADVGLAVEVPHLNMLMHMVHNRPIDYWYEFDLRKLAFCTDILRLPGESKGADMEVTKAIDLKLGVWFNLDRLIEAYGR